MSETKLKRKPDKGNVTKFITDTIKKRECNRFRKDTNQQETEICECGYSRYSHCGEAFRNVSNQSEPWTKTFPTDAFGKLEDDEEYIDWKTKLKDIRYVRLDCDTDASKILELFWISYTWNMAKPAVIFSVLSDSDFDNGEGKGHKMIEIQQIRKMICKSFVEAASLTNAWIITCGLNKGVDQLIGNGVKHRLAIGEKIPRAVLGICQWGCLAKKKDLLNASSESNGYASDSNPTGLFLNQHHTHFLLVDDGTQKRSGCERILRKKVELALTKRETNDGESLSDRECDGSQPLIQNSSHPKVPGSQEIPLIYILIGGSVNAFRFVERALANGNPVIIAAGTGGAADIISGSVTSKDGLTVENLPEIFEKLFHRLDELLSAGGTPKSKVRQVIANIKGKTKFEPLLEIVELLDKIRVSEEGDQQLFRNEIDSMQKTETNELLADIKDLLMIIQTSSDDSYHSSVNSEFDPVDRMRDVIKQMLVVNEVQPENAKQAVDDLEQNVLNDALTKIRLVYADLKAIRKHDQLIRFNIKGRQKETIIVEALKKVYWTNPSDLYMRFADCDNEKFFKQLLVENWTRKEYENVFRKLLSRKVYLCKYVKLMIEHIGNCNWLTEPEGPLEEDFKKNTLCAILVEKLMGLRNCRDTDDKRLRIKAKLLFIWCVVNHMAETAMLFWEQGQDCLTMTLVAYDESRKVRETESQKDPVDKVPYAEMEQQQQFFAELALDFVSKCYTEKSKETYFLLKSTVTDLDDRMPAKIAYEANFDAFIYTDPIHYLMSRIWTRRIVKYSKYKYIPMMLSVACPLLAPVLFTVYEDGNDDKEHDEKQSSKISQRWKGMVSYFQKVNTFVNTAFVTFYYSFISYIAYMTLFSVVMLSDFRAKISPSEITLTIWTFILIIEEFIQFVDYKDEYWRNGWNYFDIGTLTFYVIGFFLRIVCHVDPTICPVCLYVARIILAFSLLICFFRTLQFLSIYESLGPKIHMLRGLVADLVGFLLILVVFVSAYGVVSNIILYPNQPLSATLLRDVFYDAWWSVIQQFNMDALGSNCNKNNVSATITAEYCSSMSDNNVDYVNCKENQCPANNWIVSVLLTFYALLTCIMLLNVLIAMFNSTFADIEKKEKLVSGMQRFRLTMEYCSHSMIPLPLRVITYPFRFAKYLYNLGPLCSHNNNRTTKSDVEDGHNGEKLGPSKNYDENQLSMAKDWEPCMVTKYCKENKGKKGWPGPRIQSETSDNFDEIPWIEQIANQMKDLSSEETETRICRETMAFQNRLTQLIRERQEKD